MKLEYSDKLRDEILDAYLQPLIQNIKKEKFNKREGISPIQNRLTIEWLEEMK